MSSHRVVLSKLFRQAGLRQADVAEMMGYKSASMIGMMLKGERNIGRQELDRMCEIVGITFVELASKSDDLKIAKSDNALVAAQIMDSLSADLQEDALTVLKALKVIDKHFGL